jgi:Putative metallopeptidase
VVLLVGLNSVAGTVVAQPAPSQLPAPTGNFQTRIDAAALALRDNNPRFKHLSPNYVQGLAEFVSGNMLFVLLHEMAQVSITQMRLPVLGRMEDAADTYAALRLIRSGSNFSHRVLTEAAEGWFMADRRDQKAGDPVAYYDEHGLNQQRAYQIVCLMVGSDGEKFKDLAKETKLPEERRGSCAEDYSNAVFATLLDEGRYHGSIRTMYRLLAGQSQTGERRRQNSSSLR